MTASVKLDTYGLQQALKAMQKIDPAARRALLKEIKTAAEPLVNTINDRIPSSAPMSGMRNDGRTGWSNVKKVQVSLNTRKPRRSVERPGSEFVSVVRIITKGAPVAIADMAGKAGGTKSRRPPENQRPNFATVLSGRIGAPSRFMWRNIEEAQRAAERAMKPIIDRVMADAQGDFK